MLQPVSTITHKAKKDLADLFILLGEAGTPERSHKFHPTETGKSTLELKNTSILNKPSMNPTVDTDS